MAYEIQASDLTDYLEHIYQLEKELYQIEKLEGWLKQWIKNCRNPKMKQHIEAEHEYTYNLLELFILSDDFEATLGAILLSGIFGGIFGAIYKAVFVPNAYYVTLTKCICIGILWSIALLFIIHFIYTLTINMLHIKRNKAHKAYAEQQNGNIDNENENYRLFLKQKADIAMKDLDKLLNAKRALNSTLNNYYSKSIIFPKYRNLVTISSLYEYFVTGRCLTLGVSDSGHEGAYNIYERELCENRIIAQLDQVIKRLDQIIENQQMLYSAINECNETFKRIETNMKDSFEKLQNSEDVNIYNSKIIQQNTEYLAWLESTKWIWETA